MARVKISDIIDRLDSDIRPALKEAIDEVYPHNHIDECSLFDAFQRAVDRKCSTWERVPDRFVELDD